MEGKNELKYQGTNTRRECKVYCNDNLVYTGTPTECCKAINHANWQPYVSKRIVKGENIIIRDSYRFELDKIEPILISDPGDPRLSRSFLKAIEHCRVADVTPLFTIDDWKGTSESVGKDSYNLRYSVRCNKCQNVYETYFKPSKPLGTGLIQCPYCNTGQRSKDASLIAVQRELEDNKIKLVSGQEWHGRSKEYLVECLDCGLQFKTSLKRKHFNNCPYCHESSNKDNQLPKLQKRCKENHLTLLDTEYRPGLKEGRPSYKVKCDICGTEFYAKFIGKQITNCPTCCQRKQRSNRERLVSALLTDLGLEHFCNYRLHGVCLGGSTQPCEIDIYIPSLKTGFEFNGQAYHNCGEGLYHKSKDYHRLKTEAFLKQGIKLYHIWDYVSDELVESIVRAKCGKSTKLHARKCEVKEISSEQAKNALTLWHVDGYIRSNKCYGLFYNQQLVACLTLLNRQIQSLHTTVWEIGRFATKLNLTVVGGYSKLLKVAIEYLKTIGVKELVSYCNRDFSPDSSSTFYAKQGFILERDSGCIYWYWASRNIILNNQEFKRGDKLSRQKLQKQLLLKHYNDNDLELPTPCNEKTLAEGLGLYPCYNSGNWKYILNIF